MSDINYMDLTEFVEGGFLQEVNRQFFHPLGLALEVCIDDDGTYTLGGVWDYRDDPEGMVFFFKDDANAEEREAKAKNVQEERERHITHRLEMFGQIQQPLATMIDESVAYRSEDGN